MRKLSKEHKKALVALKNVLMKFEIWMLMVCFCCVILMLLLEFDFCTEYLNGFQAVYTTEVCWLLDCWANANALNLFWNLFSLKCDQINSLENLNKKCIIGMLLYNCCQWYKLQRCMLHKKNCLLVNLSLTKWFIHCKTFRKYLIYKTYSNQLDRTKNSPSF